MKNSIHPTMPDQVEPAFPPEFLDCFTETAFKTLTDYLIRTGASDEVLELLDSAQFLLKESALMGTGKVERHLNQSLIDSVTDASRCIVALGGVFYAPSGSSTPRGDQDQLQGSGGLTDILQDIPTEKTTSRACTARNKAAVGAPEGLQ